MTGALERGQREGHAPRQQRELARETDARVARGVRVGASRAFRFRFFFDKSRSVRVAKSWDALVALVRELHRQRREREERGGGERRLGELAPAGGERDELEVGPPREVRDGDGGEERLGIGVEHQQRGGDVDAQRGREEKEPRRARPHGIGHTARVYQASTHERARRRERGAHRVLADRADMTWNTKALFGRAKNL